MKTHSKRSSDYPMLSFENAWGRIAAVLTPLPPVLKPLTHVTGLVLAEDIIAQDNMPPFASATMDGYAIHSHDPSLDRSVIGEQVAGVPFGLSVKKGTAVRIMTGAPLPEGADTVIPFEQTKEDAGIVRLFCSVTPGTNVRPVGQDITANQVVLSKGSVLGPAAIGILAALGRLQVLVHPRPQLAIMATGDELVRADAIPMPGQIRDCNTPALLAAAEVCGFDAISASFPVGDQTAALEQSLVNALASSDVVVTSGGVSMGTFDLIKPLLARLGEILVGRTAVKPGKPFTFAMVKGKPVFGLPGFPVSSLVCFELFVRPALRLLSGLPLLWRPCVEVRLAQTIDHAPDRTEFQRAIIKHNQNGFTAYSNGSQSSGRLKSLVGADALLILPAGESDFPTGSRVMAYLINQPEVSTDLAFCPSSKKHDPSWGEMVAGGDFH